MQIKKSFFLLCLLLVSFSMQAQNTDLSKNTDPKMTWFADAKLGIFIHWGIYSVNGISESWSFFNNYTNHETYMKQLKGFTAANYRPQEWVNLIKESGAKYAVITSKHHDGVSLWDTKAPNAVTTIKNSAAKSDVLTPFVDALKKSGLKTGIYYSLPDWSYEDYNVFTSKRNRYNIKEEPKRWQTFLDYQQEQLKELSKQYKPDLLWFDGNWEHSAADWQADKVHSLLRKYNPNIIINARLDNKGDYDTPEQGIPVLKPAAPYWELCYTMNDSWGYQPYDTKYKTGNMIIRTLVDCMSMGGNLLLDIGPKPDGTIAAEQSNILKDLGVWTKKHAEAIYGTRAGIPTQHFNGKTTLSEDKKTLFLYVDYQDKNGLMLSGVKSQIKKASVIGAGGNVKFKELGNDNWLIQVPEKSFDKDVTVVKLQFNQAIELSKPIFDDLKSANTSNAKIKMVEHKIAEGNNPFSNTDLSFDGTGYQPSGDKEYDEWVIKNAEALYKTTKGISNGHYQGKSALSADKKTLYLFVDGNPTGPIALKGIKNGISRIRVVGEGTILLSDTFNKLYWSKVPGITYIPVPADKTDKNVTVIAVLLDGPIDLFEEKVTAIESNL
ncbi:alpha-L-fucosidase [Pedobacter sp. MW01-1-1]|uniref:alpha-L-fucosidase n=1 Tax=Pedobacter sp. MW01-1-1 TaxID=3383027 RepID=UPI003FF0AF30